jgi:hypothetical protein
MQHKGMIFITLNPDHRHIEHKKIPFLRQKTGV